MNLSIFILFHLRFNFLITFEILFVCSCTLLIKKNKIKQPQFVICFNSPFLGDENHSVLTKCCALTYSPALVIIIMVI